MYMCKNRLLLRGEMGGCKWPVTEVALFLVPVLAHFTLSIWLKRAKYRQSLLSLRTVTLPKHCRRGRQKVSKGGG